MVVITTAQFHQPSLNSGSAQVQNPARGLSEIRDGEDLWQWIRLNIRLNTFFRSNIPQKQLSSSSWTKWTVSYYLKLTGKNKKTTFTKYLQIVTKNTKNVNWKQNRFKWNIFSSPEIQSQATNFLIFISCK